MVIINIKKKDFYLISALFIFLIGAGYVVAYNPGTGNPAVMGHSFEELENAQFKITNGLTACSDANLAVKTINPATGAVTCETDDVGETGFSHFLVFDADGTFTVPAGVTKIMAEAWGGGGNGGKGCDALCSVCGGGAGGGGYCKKIISVTPGQSIAVTVASRLSGIGATTTFGSYLTATGGQKGQDATLSGGVWTANGGIGGTCTTVGLDVIRTGGSSGINGLYCNGIGGAAGGGGGGGGSATPRDAGGDGNLPGGGGGGGGYYNKLGGDGANNQAGRVVVWW